MDTNALLLTFAISKASKAAAAAAAVAATGRALGFYSLGARSNTI